MSAGTLMRVYCAYSSERPETPEIRVYCHEQALRRAADNAQVRYILPWYAAIMQGIRQQQQHKHARRALYVPKRVVGETQAVSLGTGARA